MSFDFGGDILVDAMRPVGGLSWSFENTRSASAPKSTEAPTFKNVLSRDQTEQVVTKASSGAAYERFEASVLSVFVEMMLPKDQEAVFGSGFAGDMWRSQLAFHIAGELAKAGGIGIAERLQAEGKSV